MTSISELLDEWPVSYDDLLSYRKTHNRRTIKASRLEFKVDFDDENSVYAGRVFLHYATETEGVSSELEKAQKTLFELVERESGLGMSDWPELDKQSSQSTLLRTTLERLKEQCIDQLGKVQSESTVEASKSIGLAHETLLNEWARNDRILNEGMEDAERDSHLKDDVTKRDFALS